MEGQLGMQILLQQGDITKLEVDAIVNAANSTLLGGGGVDGAIHKAGGPAILEACMKIREQQGGCAVGEAVITTAGKLPSSYVIHTVGPVWKGGDAGEADLLRNCYVHSLGLARQHHIQSIAFPNISTGVYGYPKEAAAAVAVQAVRDTPDDQIKQLIFVCFDDENYRIYQNLLTN